MNRKKSYANTTISFSIINTVALCLLFALCLTGCAPELEDDYSISEITIYNIPAEIPVMGKPELPPSPTFKVYLNASDSSDATDDPKARGLAKVSTGTLETNGTYTVTFKLYKPIPKNEDDPNYPTDPWSGTASFFSVMISPYIITADEENLIWIIGSMDELNKGKKKCDWNSLLDFRKHIENNTALSSALDLPGKYKALYEDIICKDPELAH